MIKALIFVGGSFVEASNAVELPEWTEQAILTAFEAHQGEGWLDEVILGESTKIRDTFDMVSDNLAQIQECSCDGGQLYIVRL